MLNRAMPELESQPWILRVLYSSYFYLSLASGLGAFRRLDGPRAVLRRSRRSARNDFRWADFLFFPTVAGFIGMFLGAAEGIMCRNAQRARSAPASAWGSASRADSALILGSIIMVMMVMVAAMFTGWQPKAGRDADGRGPLDLHDGPSRGVGGGGDPRRDRPGDRLARAEGDARMACSAACWAGCSAAWCSIRSA